MIDPRDIDPRLTGLNWHWIGLEIGVTPFAGLLAAFPLWRADQPVLGNIAGTIVIFGTAFGLILREHIELDRLARACIDAGTTCFPHPEAFTRFSVYAFVALFEVIALFMLSIRVEERRRRRGYDPQWR